MKYTTLLFDLDGTLTDPKTGITRCIQYALEKLHRPTPGADELTWCIGPPLRESFKKLLGSDSSVEADAALGYYRKRFDRIGKYENRVYDAIPETLEELNGCGKTLYVATSKPEVFAEDILIHFGLDKYFRGIYGSELNGDRTDKADLIAHLLIREGLDSRSTVMVGDRLHDIVGAKQCGLHSIGVTYGYGIREELTGAGADWLVDRPEEIVKLVE